MQKPAKFTRGMPDGCCGTSASPASSATEQLIFESSIMHASSVARKNPACGCKSAPDSLNPADETLAMRLDSVGRPLLLSFATLEA